MDMRDLLVKVTRIEETQKSLHIKLDNHIAHLEEEQTISRSERFKMKLALIGSFTALGIWVLSQFARGNI